MEDFFRIFKKFSRILLNFSRNFLELSNNFLEFLRIFSKYQNITIYVSKYFFEIVKKFLEFSKNFFEIFNKISRIFPGISLETSKKFLEIFKNFVEFFKKFSRISAQKGQKHTFFPENSLQIIQIDRLNLLLSKILKQCIKFGSDRKSEGIWGLLGLGNHSSFTPRFRLGCKFLQNYFQFLIFDKTINTKIQSFCWKSNDLKMLTSNSDWKNRRSKYLIDFQKMLDSQPYKKLLKYEGDHLLGFLGQSFPPSISEFDKAFKIIRLYLYPQSDSFLCF